MERKRSSITDNRLVGSFGFWTIILLTVIGIVVSWWLITDYIHDKYPDDYGTFGDSFGAVNALFSGLALAGVIIAIMLQSADLRAQSEALRLQTEEMEDTTKALEAQAKLLNEQVQHSRVDQFDSRFFEVVRAARNAIQQFDVAFPGGSNATGAQATSGLSSSLRNNMKLSFAAEKFQNQFGSFKLSFGRHYEPPVQLVELALEMVSECPDPKFHGTFLKASFSSEEKWLFLHVICLSRTEISETLKQVIESIAFFEGIDTRIPLMNVLGLSPQAFSSDESAVPT